MEKKGWKRLTVLMGGILFILLHINYASAAPLIPQRGGVLKFSNSSPPPICNPMADYSIRVIVFTAPVFNGLVMIDPTQEDVTLEKIVPSLAEKWTISPDGRVYTFYLRKGVKFHDGHPFTAGDAKYSLDFFADPEKSAGLAPMMERAEIVDDYTVKVYLKYRHVPFLLYLCAPYCVMLPAHLSKVSPKSPDFLIGTGPFKFKNRIHGKVWVYERNPDYFIKGLPYLDGIEIYEVKTIASVDAFCAGRLSLNQYLSEQTLLDRVRKLVPEAIIKVKPINVLRGVFFNVAGLKGRKGAWQDVNVRRAMALVTDFPGSIIAAQGSPELGVNSGVVPPFVPSGLPWKEVGKILGIDKPMEQRIKEAKRLMKEAGYPDGFKAEMISRETNAFWKAGEFLIDSWRKHLNIRVDLKIPEGPIFFPRRDAGQFDMAVEPVIGTIGAVPEETLRWFLSKAITNYGQWSNPEYDKLYESLVRETDARKREGISVRMQRIFLSEVPFITYHSPSVGRVYRPGLHNFVLQTGHITGWAATDQMWMEK